MVSKVSQVTRHVRLIEKLALPDFWEPDESSYLPEARLRFPSPLFVELQNFGIRREPWVYLPGPE